MLRSINHVGRYFSKVIFPVHPHTKQRLAKFNVDLEKFHRIDFVDPMLPFDALSHIGHAKLVLTDSGVVQEEAYILERPCVTIRENTERHLSVEYLANVVAGLSFRGISHAVGKQLNVGKLTYPPIYGDYGAGRRIVEAFCQLREFDAEEFGSMQPNASSTDSIGTNNQWSISNVN